MFAVPPPVRSEELSRPVLSERVEPSYRHSERRIDPPEPSGAGFKPACDRQDACPTGTHMESSFGR